MQETRVPSLGREDPPERGMATHTSILAWEIPWTKEPGGLESMGSHRVGHDWATQPPPPRAYSAALPEGVYSLLVWRADQEVREKAWGGVGWGGVRVEGLRGRLQGVTANTTSTLHARCTALYRLTCQEPNEAGAGVTPFSRGANWGWVRWSNCWDMAGPASEPRQPALCCAAFPASF